MLRRNSINCKGKKGKGQRHRQRQLQSQIKPNTTTITSPTTTSSNTTSTITTPITTISKAMNPSNGVNTSKSTGITRNSGIDGSDRSSTETPSTNFHIFNMMPRPGLPDAPLFDGTDVTEFLHRWNIGCDDVGAFRREKLQSSSLLYQRCQRCCCRTSRLIPMWPKSRARFLVTSRPGLIPQLGARWARSNVIDFSARN